MSVVELAKQAPITASSEWVNNGFLYSKERLVDGVPGGKTWPDFQKHCYCSKVGRREALFNISGPERCLIFLLQNLYISLKIFIILDAISQFLQKGAFIWLFVGQFFIILFNVNKCTRTHTLCSAHHGPFYLSLLALFYLLLSLPLSVCVCV